MAAATAPASPCPPGNQALTPIAPQQRAFATRDHAALWFSLGVGLLVMQVGAYLMPALSPQAALAAIMAGSLLGAGLLAWVAKIACDTGLASAGLMHAVYGRHFARLPILLNIVQLLGWGAFELVVMRDATLAIATQAGLQPGSAGLPLATLFWGAVVLLLISGSMVQLVRRLIARIALPLVLLSLLWLSWQFLALAQSQGWAALWQRPGSGGMGVMAALDLVIAMPISWLPLVADYARHGRSGRGALAGTWVGYLLANIWCYSLGVLVALVLPSQDLVTALLLAQGGLLALSLILIDEVDNAYGDAYSGAVSAHSLWPRWSIRRLGVAMAVACTLAAMALPMHSLEPFLLLLSSVFVPLFGVMLGRLAWGAAQPLVAQVGVAHSPGVHWLPVLLWLAGVVCYHLLPRLAPVLGAALPTLALCLLLSWLTRGQGAGQDSLKTAA